VKQLRAFKNIFPFWELWALKGYPFAQATHFWKISSSRGF